MQVTVAQLLKVLPPFRNERVMVKKYQRVNDIIEQILIAHEKYAHYYDLISGFFDDDDVTKICDNLYFFIQKNIKYEEESEDAQTTALPSAILTLRKGDCKHYSLFCNGVLDALKRQGKKIDWFYRFCSYDILNKTPHHVFVVVKKNDGSEIWIDAVPGANQQTPIWQIDETIKTKSMPLYDVIGSTHNSNTVGWTTQQKIVHATAKVNPLLIAGRAAFLQMLKWNVRAWAKNIQYLTNTYGRQASDPIGTKWYLLGGDSAPFWAAVLEGSTKKMIGSVDNDNRIGLTGVEITALITAAAPIIIAMTTMVKSLAGKDDWQEGQLLSPTGGVYIPPTTGTGSTANNLLRNPIVLAGGAALAYYLLTKKKTVSGANDNTMLLLLLAAGGFLLYKNKINPMPVEEPLLLPPPDTSLTSDPGQPVNDAGNDLVMEDNFGKDEIMDSNIPVEVLAM